MKNSNVQGKDQQHQKMIAVQDKEGMGSKGDAMATTIMGITDRMRPQKKREIGSMHSLVRNTKDNTFGVNVEQTSMVTIKTVTTEETKATREITEETRETNTKAIPMQATAVGSPPDYTMWMNTGT